MYDLASIGFLIGQGIGRWGNFVNQEAYGGFTGSNWWGMESTRTILEMGEGLVHPCFLYESIWCLLGVVNIHCINSVLLAMLTSAACFPVMLLNEPRG